MFFVKVAVRKVWRILARAAWWIETVTMLAISRFLIKFVPFRYWRWSIGKIDQTKVPAIDKQQPVAEAKAITVGRWVRRTARSMPFEAVCLPQAIAGRWMLKRRGIESQICFGVRHDSDLKSSEFHAWLMVGDMCLTGRHEKGDFQAFSRGADD